jgi:membrane protein implicated in regulation of membrane protease activity
MEVMRVINQQGVIQMLTFYIICFWVGLILTLVTTLFGGHGTHSIHIDMDMDTHSGQIQGHGHSPINVSTVLAFLTGFGGTGYILVKNYFFSSLLILIIASSIGLVIGALLFMFLSKVLMRDENVMKEVNYQLEGTLGTITAAVPPFGIGEMKYVLGGTTRSIGVKAQHGNEINKGTKVVIVRLDKGIAEVTLFEE